MFLGFIGFRGSGVFVADWGSGLKVLLPLGCRACGVGFLMVHGLGFRVQDRSGICGSTDLRPLSRLGCSL